MSIKADGNELSIENMLAEREAELRDIGDSLDDILKRFRRELAPIELLRSEILFLRQRIQKSHSEAKADYDAF